VADVERRHFLVWLSDEVSSDQRDRPWVDGAELERALDGIVDDCSFVLAMKQQHLDKRACPGRFAKAPCASAPTAPRRSATITAQFYLPRAW
jgi:hypothetical protein